MVLQQDLALHRPVPALDLALGHRVIRLAPCVRHGSRDWSVRISLYSASVICAPPPSAGQADGDECGGGKQVILAALVDDAQIAGGERVLVRQCAVDLVQIQGIRVVGVFDADDVLGGMVVRVLMVSPGSICVSPRGGRCLGLRTGVARRDGCRRCSFGAFPRQHVRIVGCAPFTRRFLSPDRLDLEVHALSLLQATDDLKQVARLGIAVRTEHAHQAFG